MSEELKTIITYLQEGNRRIGAIEARLVNIETTCTKHARLLTDGNGQPSVLQQIEKIRSQCEHLSTTQNDHEEKFQELTNTKIEELKSEDLNCDQDRRAHSQNRIAVIVAIIAAVAALASACISLYHVKGP